MLFLDSSSVLWVPGDCPQCWMWKWKWGGHHWFWKYHYVKLFSKYQEKKLKEDELGWFKVSDT